MAIHSPFKSAIVLLRWLRLFLPQADFYALKLGVQLMIESSNVSVFLGGGGEESVIKCEML